MQSSNIENLAVDLDSDDQATVRLLVALDQSHLLAHWPPPGEATEKKRRMLAQARELDASYPGGLRRYLDRARELLAAARRGENPYAGNEPHVPHGRQLTFGSDEFLGAEEVGLSVANRCAFIAVAGGLGERLGFGGIKLAIRAEVATGSCFLQRYLGHVLALQRAGNARSRVNGRAPVIIMTSDGTHTGTRRLLEEHRFFGAAPGQVTLLKQGKVPALSDDRPTIATSVDDSWHIKTKPHGHGDIHALLHQSGLPRQWLNQGVRWLVFHQDTNPLTFYGVPATLGVSEQEFFDMNSVVVPRRPGEAAGGVVRLEQAGRSLTINVEYNQLDPLLRAAGHPEGDAPDASGSSPYPGNINVFVISLESYVRTLDRTGGVIPDFVNPKYADSDRSRFASPARLECMMQDYPKLLEPGARVGFTQFERGVCFSAVKNGLSEAARRQKAGLPPESAATAEADLYALNRRYLSTAGAVVETGPTRAYSGVEVELFPIVLLSQELTVSLAEFLPRVSNVRISARSTLVIDAADVVLDGLVLDGALVVRAVPGARVVIRGLVVRNRGWEVTELEEATDSSDSRAIRGYDFVRHETRLIEITEPGEHIVQT
ncbi:MAG: UTP--glucose-1-phosphate uridylyltransferase [Polyangiaceae bacterium]|nr:UTP--glucose-1-phosphate uridylyltransferase [Polyangiaceae bacterium]